MMYPYTQLTGNFAIGSGDYAKVLIYYYIFIYSKVKQII